MSFWDSVKSTMGALGDGVTAVPGMVWDTGSYVFDDLDGDDDTNFGEYMGKMAKRGRQQVALALDPKTLSGHAFLSTMKGLDWLYSEGISQPMVTTSMMIGRAAEGHGGDVFSGDQWKRAYHLAEHRSIGQQSMLTTGAGLDALAPGQQMPDVFDPKAWQRMHEAAPLTTSVVSGSQDFAARWYLDPGNVAGKGYQAYKAAVGVRSITAADRAAGIGNLLENEFVKKVGVGPFKFSSKKAGLATRTAQLIGGTDDAGRFLPGYIDDKNAAQILRGVEELDKSAKGPQIASMLADTNKLTDAGERLEARRRILRVAYGDTAENNRVSTEIGHVNDALDNLQKDSVTNIEREMAHELQPALFYGHGEATRPFDNPDVIDAAQAQVQNLPGIAEHWDNQLADLQALEDISGSAARNPLRVSGAGQRRLARDEERTLFRDEGAIGSKIEAAKQWATADSIESVYQYGSMNMPLRIMKKLAGVGMQGTDAVYRKAPLGAIDKLRTSSPTGVVALHDVQGTVREVDSALRKVGMPHRDRFAIVSDVMGARTESERMMAVTRAESAGAYHLAERYGVDRDFIDTVMQRGYRRRKGMMMSLKGRAYSASTSADGLRVDMFDDHGVPVALPMLETQNVNIMPMLDMEHAEKMLARDRRIAKISKAWKAENDELEKYAKQRLTKGDSLAEITKGLYSVADHMLVWGDELMRYWKFSALFRLGYGIRVLADDEMRIFARMGAGNQLPIWWEAIKNHGYNKVGYRFDPAARRAAIVARIQSLEDRIGSADDVKRAHDGIARIEELNGQIARGEGDVADLRGRVGTLQDTVHLDVDDLRAERDGLVSALRSGAYKRREFAAGKIQLPGGDTVDDAFSGPWAGAVRTQISSNDAMMMELEDAESSMMSHFAKAGSWRTILPQEGGAHLEGWAWAINKHLRQSKLAQVFIKGGNKDDALRYLRTPEGRRLRKQMAWVGADPEQWVTRVEKMVNDYIPEGPLREAVRSREVTPNELGDMFPDVMRRPEVHGANVDLNVGTGNISHALNKIANRYFEFVSKHTDKLGRHPYYVGMYRQNVRELHAGALAQARAAGRQLDSDDFAKITHQASRQAVHDLKKTLFDISAHSNAATMMRFVSPFFAAHQESIAKWYRIISDDPSVVRRFQQFFDIPRKLGLTVNVNTGKPVASGEPVSSDHAIMIQVPRAWLSKQDQSKWKTDWTISEESFNLILQSGGVFNPGVGPMVQAPLDHFARTLADQPDIEKLARLLNPIPSDSVADAILPAAVRRTFAALAGENSHEFSASMAMDLNDRLVQFQEDKHRGPTQAEYNRMVVESKKSTQIRAWLRVGQQMLSPVSIRPGSRFAAQRAGWYKLLDQSYQNGKGYQWAEQQFLNKYGAAMAPLMESTSNNVAGIQSRSAETIASIKRHRGLLDVVNPKLAALVIGPEGEGAFSDAANAALKGMRVQPGTDQTYISYDDPRDAGMEALVSEGWRRYNKITSGLNAQAHAYGLASYTDSTELSDLKAKATRQLAEQNFAWWQDYNSFDPSEYDRMVDDMKVIAKDRTLNGDTARNDIQVLKRYLDARDVMTQQLQSRDAMGGSADPTAVSNQDLSQWFTYQVSQLVESNTSFAQFAFDPVIERDPYLSQQQGVSISAA